MNNILNKLERKFGRYAVPDLIKYVVMLYGAGAVIGILDSLNGTNIYYNYLCLDVDAVFHGQIWRLFTYLLEPYGFMSGGGFLLSALFFLIQVQLFLMFGRSLEQAWGTFRFNMYFFSGYILNIVAAIIMYVSPMHQSIYYSGFQYIYWAMFFAFAMLNPNIQFLLYFVIPIKVKWLAILDAVYLLYTVVKDVVEGVKYFLDPLVPNAYGGAYISAAIAIVVAMANFLIFFFATRNYRRVSPKEIHRRRKFKKETAAQNGMPRHRCAVCGRTELDNENLDFRFCSKCDGNYEYCSEHLFTHQHVKKFM